MADNKKQPTILVKKSDGTKVRMTLAEYKKMRSSDQQTADNEQRTINNEQPVANNQQVILTNDVVEKKEEPQENIVARQPAPAQPAVTLVKKEDEVGEENKEAPVAEENELTTTTPVTDIFVNEAAANFEWNEKDSKSLLEEDSKEIEDLKKKGKAHVTGHDLEEHIKMPHVEVDEDLKNRAKSLVVSWRKGIRNEFQVLDYAKRDVNHGGLGLTEEQANRFLEKIQDSKSNFDNLFDIIFEKKSTFSKDSVDTQDNSEEKKDEQTAKSNTLALENKMPAKMDVPIVDKSIGNAMTPSAPVQKTLNPIQSTNDFSKPYSHTPPQSVVYDVAPPSTMKSRTTGPKQEIAEFGLVDYRRLARNPEKCADMLKAKFEGWKKESFLLYLDTLDGWQLSPLNKMYVDTTVEALNNKMTVSQVLQTKDPNSFLTLAEYQSLTDISDVML